MTLVVFASSLLADEVDLSVHPAPDFGSGLQWLDQGDSSPHHIAGYRGHVLLIDFWEYTCINCIRDFTVVKSWYSKYHPLGLGVIGIHYAEFTMGDQAQNIRDAAARFRLPWPIAADLTGDTWKAYASQGWPMRYLIDANGNIVMKVFGERNNLEMETRIRSLLATTHPEVKNIQLNPADSEFGPHCGSTTAETFVGSVHGRSSVADLENHRNGDVAELVPPHSPADGSVMLAGRWKIEEEGVTSQSNGASAEIRYHARSLYSVLSVSGKKEVRVNVFEDGNSLPKDSAGADVKFDKDGAYVEVTEPRMYYIVRSPGIGAHLVALQADHPGLTLHTFTFGNECQVNDTP